MTKKPRRLFTDEQKAEAVRISAALVGFACLTQQGSGTTPAGHVTQSGRPVSEGFIKRGQIQWVHTGWHCPKTDPNK
jgi:hypothetical protein